MKLINRYKRLSIWNQFYVISGIVSVLSFLFVFFFYFFPYHSKDFNIIHTEIKDNTLSVFSPSGICWIYNFTGTINKSKIVNLFNKKNKQILVSIGKGDDKNIDDCGTLFCFNNKGTLIWKYKCPTDFNYSGAKSGKITIIDFWVENFYNNKTQILLNCRDADGWYQSYLSLLNNNGEHLYTYWHPGFINNIISLNENPNKKSIVFSATNNDISPLFKGEGRIYVIGKLPYNFKGEAPPLGGKSTQGNELWYLGILPKNIGVTKLLISDFNKDGVNDISIWTESGYNIHLSLKGKIIGGSATDKKDKKDIRIVKIK